MKQTILAIALAMAATLAAEPVDAQMRFGVRGGFNFATVTGDYADGQGPDSDGEGTRTGMMGGVFLEAPLGGIIGLHLGANYSQKGWEAEGIPGAEGGDLLTELDYIEVPALAVVSVPVAASSLRLYAGPSLSYLIKCKGTSFDVSFDCEDRNGEDEVTKFDLGGTVGAGFKFGVGGASMLLDGFLSMGLKTLLKDDADLELKNETWTVSLGVML